MKISLEVQNALKYGTPVIALESTIISFGMPYPQNVKTALEVEQVIRDNNCIPATIGIINGEPVVGMSHQEIEEFGKRKDVRKCSKRDLPIVYATHGYGATTVTATMIIAHQAGIEFFVTGGIGGAHRNSDKTFDISTDLEELGRTDTTVICAGPKAILDLDKTMEILETKGVPVIGYNTDCLPAFFTRTSSLKADYNAKTPEEISDIVHAKRKNNINGGILVVNPIPEEYAMDPKVINKAIDEALIEMEKAGIKGKDETPYLLAKIVELTKGKSLEANIHLVKNNAKLGCLVARKYNGK
ncbi:MAG: pseudouridine-5'-phosphate glycosidase [Bacilli bacterium]